MSYLLEAGPFSARDGEGRVLFTEVSLQVQERSLVTLVGPSGSGKSTFLRQLVGLDSTEGAERVLGGELFRRSRLPAWRARVTLLGQDAPVVPGTIGDNLRLPFFLRAGHGRRFDAGVARELLDAVGLDSIAMERDVRTLSGGERHRLALVRGLLWDPPVLVADEPFSGLDPDAAAVCVELLAWRAHRAGHAVLAVLHDPAAAARADQRLRLTPTAVEAA